MPAKRNATSGRIRQRNIGKILRAAQDVFATKGFSGASTSEIAELAGVPKANLHYYFRTKQDLYSRVLETILADWLDAMDEIRRDADPVEALQLYIGRKVEASRRAPELSRIWATELIGGARHVQPFLRKRLRALVRQKSEVIEHWIADGRIDPIDPRHLLFAIWAMTQTYADFAAQIEAVLGRTALADKDYDTARKTVATLVLRGLGLRPRL